MKEPVSTPWIVGALAIYLVAEALLGGLLGTLLGGFVSHPFRMRIEVLLLLTSFWVGGFVVGLVSPKVRLLEPGVAAFLAVALTSLYAVFMPMTWFVFSVGRVLLGGGIAFGLALWGADSGERVAARLGNKASQDYAAR